MQGPAGELETLGGPDPDLDERRYADPPEAPAAQARAQDADPPETPAAQARARDADEPEEPVVLEAKDGQPPGAAAAEPVRAAPDAEARGLPVVAGSRALVVVPRTPRGPSRGARIGLDVGAAVFAAGALIQLLATSWLALVTVLFAGAAAVLAHTGGLDAATFGPCSIAAIVLDVGLVVAAAATSVRPRIRRGSRPPAGDHGEHGDRGHDPRGGHGERGQRGNRGWRGDFWRRHPLLAIGVGLGCALVVVVVAAWSPSAYFPHPLATVIVLANAYYVALAGLFTAAGLADRAWRRIRAWSVASEYRAGLLTASLALLGVAGGWWLHTAWYRAPLHALREQLESDDAGGEPPRLDGPEPERGPVARVLAAELDALCLAADALEPQLAESSAAPACMLRVGPTARQDRCFTRLARRAGEAVRERPAAGGARAELADAAVKAVIATCARDVPAEDALATAIAEQLGDGTGAGHARGCDELGGRVGGCTPVDPPVLQRLKRAALWDAALCELAAGDADIVRRMLQHGESFREIAGHLAQPELEVRKAFHRAIKQIRRRVASCDERP